MARLGATQPSYETAGATLERLTGLAASDTTLWRRTNETGAAIAAVLENEEAAVTQLPAAEACPQAEAVPEYHPIAEHANVSVDGTRILTRESGGREIKLVAVSQAVVEEVVDEPGPREAVRLRDHSYRGRLCPLAEFAPALSAETARRRVHRAHQVTSVNDGGPGIGDLVATVLPGATQVLDWPHAVSHLWKAGVAAFGDGTAPTIAWVQDRKTELWAGQVREVQQALADLRPGGDEAADKIRQVQEYVTEHVPRMDYARFRVEGRPIGSGTVESGARNVVKWRMARGGARWAEARVNPMLALLGELGSGRYDEAWDRIYEPRMAA